MTTVKTTLDENPAARTPFSPTTSIPKSDVQSAIESVQGSMDGFQNEIDALTVSVETLSNTVGALSGSVEQLSDDVDGLSNTVAQFSSSINEVSDAVDLVANTVDQLSNAEFLVFGLSDALGAERLIANTATILWDLSSPGEAKVVRAALTGDVTAGEGASNTAIANQAVTFAKFQNIAADRLLGRDTASSGSVEEITVGGGLEFTGSGGIRRAALTGDVMAAAGASNTAIVDEAVTFAKIQHIATDRLVGRDTASSGDLEQITVGGGLEFTGSGGIRRSALTGAVTSGAGAANTAISDNAVQTSHIANDAITNGKLRNSAALSVIGNATNASADPADIGAGSDHQVLRRSGTAIGFGAVALNQGNAVTGTLPIGNGGTGQTMAGAAFDALKQSANTTYLGVVEKATDAEVRSAASDKYLSADHLETAAAAVSMSDAATIAFDWEEGIYRTIAISANRTLGNPTNGHPGTWRTILVEGNDGNTRTLSFGNQFGGTLPTITDCTSSKKYLLSVFCKTSTQFLVTAMDGSDA